MQEYARVVTIVVDFGDRRPYLQWYGTRHKPSTIHPQLDDCARILEVRPEEWGQEEEGEHFFMGRRRREEALLASGCRCVLKVGVPWSKSDFVTIAAAVDHPILTASVATASDSLQAVFNILTLGPEAIRRKRKDFLDMLRTWELDLRGAEEAIKSNMHPKVRAVMQGKKITVIKRLMEHIGFKDSFLIRDLVSGSILSALWTSVASSPLRRGRRRRQWTN